VSDVAVGPDASGAPGSAWAISTTPKSGGYQILKWDGNKFVPDQSGAGAIQIAVGPGDTPWIVNSNHQVFERTGSSWGAPLAGKDGSTPASVSDVGVGPNDPGAPGSAWAISTTPENGGYQILVWDGSKFVPDQSGAGAIQIAVGPGDTPWIVNSNHQVFEWNGSSWGGPLPGKDGSTPASVSDVAVGPDDSVWVIGTTPIANVGYQILKWDGTKFAQTTGAAVELAVGPGDTPWQVNRLHEVYRSSW
jgi:hypothetical protein